MQKKIDSYWWKKSQEDLPQVLFGLVSYIDQQQQYVFNDNLRNAKLYGNVDILGINAYQYMPTLLPSSSSQSKLTYNVVQSVIDTVTNKIAKNKPRPFFLTSGGTWEMQKKSEKMTEFCDALFGKTNFYDFSVGAFRDACIFDSGGYIKLFRDGSEVCVERVLSQEIKFDDIEAFYGAPRSMYQVKNMNREVLTWMFPSKKNVIFNAPEHTINAGFTTSIADNIMVVEAWHLPNGYGKEGRHVISLQNGVLLDEKWTASYFPFVNLFWTKPLMGNRGQSLATQLTGIQVEVNRTLQTIQKILRLVVPKLYVEKGAKIAYNHLNNEIGGVIEYSGTKPSTDVLQAVPPDLLRHVADLINRAYELAGVSQLAAQAKKPAGLDSGKALREFNDIESERFVIKGLEYENMHIQASRQMLRIVKDIFEDEGRFKVPYARKKVFEEIDWKEINLDEDEYSIQAYPTSFLSKTPAGRLQDVTELMQAGFIGKEDGMRLMDFPDLKAFTSLETAQSEDISSVMEAMIEKGVYQAPEPYQNLEYGIKKFQSGYLRAKMSGVPEARLDLLRRWMDEAASQLQLLAPPAQPQAPLAVPEAPPVSDILPMA